MLAIEDRRVSYQVLPPLRLEEYQALKADIARRGVLVAVEFDEHGNILDGHNRAAIAEELGIGFPRVVRQFGSEQEKREHVLKINLLRRHLGQLAWTDAFEKLAEVRGIADRLDHAGRPDGNCDTVSQLCREVGVNKRTMQRRRKLKKELVDAPDLAAKVDSGEMEAKRALRVKREREARQRTEIAAPPASLPATIDLRAGDFREVLADIAPGSVDLIFTDPPYPREFLPLWSALSEMAARILKPGALLVAYSGQFHLPAVMHFLAEHLEYVWLGGIFTPGQHNQMQQRHIRSAMKPLLFYARPPYQAGPWFDDAYTSEERIKDDHEWQQSVGAAVYYIERLTRPGDLVVDPFLGSGTTGDAAKQTGRRFTGCDDDPRALSTARERLSR